MKFRNLLELLDLTELEKKKIIFVLRTFIHDFYKILIVYGIALFLKCGLETFIIHLSFLFLRTYALGYHFKGHIICLIWSIIMFPITADFISLDLSSFYLNILIFLIMLIILIIGPTGTKKFPVLNKQHLKYLKSRLLFNMIFLYALNLFVIPFQLKQYILIGILIEFILLFIQKFMQVKERNIVIIRIQNYVLKKISLILIALCGVIVTKGCTFFFHEEEIDNSLKKANRFYTKDNRV